MNTLALIPARRGSKGVPGKNLRTVAGVPLLEYAIRAAKAAKRLTTIAITSDDGAVLELAQRHGILALRRPEGISEDTSPVTHAVSDAVGRAEQITGLSYAAVALLQPTAPLRTGANVDEAIALYLTHGVSVCSVCCCDDNHPARMYRLSETQRLVGLMPELAAVRRQDLPPVYIRNGAIYIFSTADARSGRIVTPDMVPYIMPRETSINIDSELDFLTLEAFVSRNIWAF